MSPNAVSPVPGAVSPASPAIQGRESRVAVR